MEPPSGVWASIWNFICFLPFFIGLLILGTIKGVIFCPLICLIITIGNSAIILGLWPVHFTWTYYCTLRAKRLGPVLKLVIFVLLPAPLILWPLVGIVGSILGGAGFGLFAPILATFKAVGEGKTNEFYHCIYDGTWDTVETSFTVVRDLRDVCFHSYFSVMDDLQSQEPADGKYYEIKLLHLPGAMLAGVLGFLVDIPLISIIAIGKSPYMLFKGWHRLFHDLIGREGPFLETICVPFAGLVILLWPLAVAGAVVASMLSSIFLGAYAGVIAYQESSLWLGLRYIVASLSIFDEYVNDVLDMPEGTCFPRPNYRRNAPLSRSSSRQDSVRNPPSRSDSLKAPMVELKPLELLESLFGECQHQGENLVSEGVITVKDIEDSKSNKGSGRVISIGLPAYCILKSLIRSAKANSSGILLRDNITEITSTNRPKDSVFDWFLHPLLIIKDQIKAENLSEAEEDYLCKLVILIGDPERLKTSNIGSPPKSDVKRAELEALARRLQGITKSISRYPTFKRRVEALVKSISEELAKKSGDSWPRPMPRSKSAFGRFFSQKSLSITGKTSYHGGSDPESQLVAERDIRIQ